MILKRIASQCMIYTSGERAKIIIINYYITKQEKIKDIQGVSKKIEPK